MPEITQISNLLNQLNLEHQIDSQKQCILFGIQVKSLKDLIIRIQLLESGKRVKLSALNLVKNLSSNPYREKVFRSLSSLSSNYIVNYQYELGNEEINAVIDLVLEDASLTQKQFNRCLFGMIEHIDSVAIPRIQEVMQTGIDPGETEFGEKLLLMLQEQTSKGFLDLLDNAFIARRNRGNTMSSSQFS